jgi:hypothetical protein
MSTIERGSAFHLAFLLCCCVTRAAGNGDYMMAWKLQINHIHTDDAVIDFLSTRKTNFMSATEHFE